MSKSLRSNSDGTPLIGIAARVPSLNRPSSQGIASKVPSEIRKQPDYQSQSPDVIQVSASKQPSRDVSNQGQIFLDVVDDDVLRLCYASLRSAVQEQKPGKRRNSIQNNYEVTELYWLRVN